MPKGKKWIVQPGMKHCPLCGLDKLLTEFSMARRSPDGRFTYCRLCLKKRNALRTPESRQMWHLRMKYGLEITEYKRMFRQQKGRCAICHKPQKSRWLAVDHDHKTGKVRSLLCTRCNTILGQSGDSLKLLRAVIQYLRNHI
jgi:formate dehydrogenase maturation protein FdhE